MTKRIPELDGLRGLAILLVLAVHVTQILPLPYVLMTGWCGVNLFFVLSGFLIGGILLDKRPSVTFLRDFYQRRARRILPLYLAILTVLAVLWLLGETDESANWARLAIGRPMPWRVYLTFTHNFWIPVGGWAVFGNHFWSLAVEEQFYLALPLIVWLTPRRHLMRVCVLIGLTATMARSFLFIVGSIEWSHGYTLPWFRADDLMVGVICAILVRDARAQHVIKRHVRLLAGGAIAGAVLLCLPKRLDNGAPWLYARGGMTAFGLVAGLVLLVAVSSSGAPALAWLRSRALTGLGTISYGVYLLHMPAYQAVQRVAHTRAQLWLFMALATALTLGLSALSWRYLERRFLVTRARVVQPTMRLVPVAVRS